MILEGGGTQGEVVVVLVMFGNGLGVLVVGSRGGSVFEKTCTGLDGAGGTSVDRCFRESSERSFCSLI